MAEPGHTPPRLLFVPVSGKYGMGEYARSLAIARAARERWPGAAIHFVLSRQAAYAADAPFPTTLVDASPTFYTAAVTDLIARYRPQIVIFDNAGRTAQLRAARAAGAAVVFISARQRQRRKAFRLHWMRLLDEHWIAYPRYFAGELGRIERCKLRLMGRPRLRYLDVIVPRPDAARRAGLLARIGAGAGGYALIVPGGGTGHARARDSAAVFFAAARALAQHGIASVFVGPGGDSAAAPLRIFPSLPQADLAELMRGARIAIVNGGSTLLQAIACGAACIAVPIAGDQPARVRRAAQAALAVQAPLRAGAIASRARDLWEDEAARAALAARAADFALADGVAVAIGALEHWIER